jgi:hypothetical protein
MNLAIRVFAADLGQEPADTFTRDQIPDQKFDDILANPPFNSSDWGGKNDESDPRWVHGRHPPATRTVRGCNTGSGTCAQAGKRAWCWRQPCRSRPIRRHPEPSPRTLPIDAATAASSAQAALNPSQPGPDLSPHPIGSLGLCAERGAPGNSAIRPFNWS